MAAKSNKHNDNPEANISQYKIILVEDDEGLARLTQKEIKRRGFNVKWAGTGEKALELIEGKENEILLIDYKLPDMSGKQLVQKLQKKYDYAPAFITLTGYGNEKVAAEMMKLGSHDYIVKEPKFLEALPAVLKHVCKHLDAQQQLKKTRNQLLKNLELLKETGETARVGGWEIDVVTRKPYWSETTRDIHEVPDDFDPAMQDALGFFPGEAGIRLKNAVDGAINQGIVYDLELPFVTAKGNKRWVHTIGKPEMENGKCIRLHGTFQDITRRKQTELELKRKTAVLIRTEQIAHVGSWDWEVATDEVFWSDELFRIFRLDPKKGAPSYADHPKIYTPASMKKLDAAVQKCIKTGDPFNLDLEIIRGDDTNAFCSARGFAKKNDEGKVIRLYGSFQDVTERKEQKQKFEQIYNSTSEAIIIEDIDTLKLVDCNNAALEMYGYGSKAEMIDRTIDEFSHGEEPYDKSSAFEKRDEVFKSGSITFEWRARRKNGELFWAEVNLNASKIISKHYLIAVVRDISQRKADEEKIKSSEEKFRATVESINDGFITMKDENFTVTYFNSAAEKLLGRKAKNVLDKPLFEVFPEAKGSVFEEKYREAFYTKNAVTFETFFEPEPYKNWYEVRVYPRNNHLTVFFEVITGRKKVEENIKKANKKLQLNQKKLKEINKKLALREQTNKELAYNLRERVKELRCLYSIATLIEKPGIPLREILQESVNYIPPGWQYPGKTYARIKLKDVEYQTTPFRETKNRLTHKLLTEGAYQGIIEVFLDEEGQAGDKLEFLKEEEELLFLITERLSKVIDRFEAEEQLQQARELLEETERAGKIGGWEIDAETKTQTWTEEVFRIMGIDRDKKEPEIPEGIEFIHPDYRKQAEKAVNIALEEGKPFDEEWLVVTAKGKERWMNSVCKPKFEEGKVVKITGSLQDITKQKEAEKKLRAANQQLIASEQQLMASNQQLTALNQQLISGEQQLKAANQQLEANEQQLRAANQQLVASEKELLISNETLKKYLDVAAEIVISLDENGKITLLNESGHRICGYKPGELIGKDWFSVCLPQEDRKDVLEYFSKLKKGGKGKEATYESEIMTKTGERKVILWHNTIFRDEDGNFAGTLSSGEDITARKRAERKLIESEERYKKAQEVGHIGSWEYNVKTGEFWGSDEAKRIYNLDVIKSGFSANEVMNIVVQKDRSRVNQAMIDLFSGTKPYDIVFEIAPKNTTERKIIRSIAELEKNASGNPVKATGVLHDITLQKTAEKQLVEAKEKAEEADKLKSAFLANMSHEIRTPMNGILGFTELLKNPELSGDQQQKFIEIIHKSGNRMLETVNAIIDISRIETGQTETKIAETNVNKEIETLYNFFLPEAVQKGLQLSLEKLLPDEDSYWFTDVSKFNSIFTNLVKNALKYTDEGAIDIGCEVKNGQLYCYVKDTGIGIPKERQNAIFNRFVQADIADTRAFEGSGLGLAISKAYVEMIGGKIGVKSEESKGSEFWFTLPEQAEKKRHEAGKTPVENSESSVSRKLKVIIAEDDEISAEFLSLLLKSTASEILVATSGEETVELCKKHPDADLVLMDIKMPKGNGYDSLKAIRKFNNDVRVIAQTANALAGDREKALKAGFDEYVSKPLRKQDLMAKMDKLFEQGS